MKSLSWAKKYFSQTSAPQKDDASSKLSRQGGREEHTNFLRVPEAVSIAFLCRIMPQWVTPNLLTGIGVMGGVMTMLGLILSRHFGSAFYLSISIAGLAVNWFGDSVDGRLAYYRNKSRKWYGWVLDLAADWLVTFLVALGFYFYLPAERLMVVLYLFTYGGCMMLLLVRYKITNMYRIEAGLLGPSEMRIITALIFLCEMFFPGVLNAYVFVAPLIIMITMLIEFKDALRLGDQRDADERQVKTHGS